MQLFICKFAYILNPMKKASVILFIILLAPFISFGQATGTCNISVTIDSNVVRPCFKLSGGFNSVNGGSCGCSNTLWAIVSGGTAPYTYAWSTAGSVQGTADTLHGACYTFWTVLVTDANNCTATASLNVLIPADSATTIDTTSSASAGINKYSKTSSLKLYPVPASNQLNVSLGGATANTHVEMYDMLGKKVLEQKVNDGESLLTLDVSPFAAGTYFLRIIGANIQKTTKFTVDR